MRYPTTSTFGLLAAALRPVAPRRPTWGRSTFAPATLAAFLVVAATAPATSATLVVLAPHPDDGEASCGGLIANATAAGHEVVVLTMTGGELGVPGMGPQEARALRTREAREAAALLGARAEMFGAVDGSLAVDAPTLERLADTLVRLHPALVLAPWPLDVHADHQATGLLAWRVFQDRRFAFELYFYETTNSPHTKSFSFTPTDFVDISEVSKKKVEAASRHRSQNAAEWMEMYVTLARVRGWDADVSSAEAYAKARSSSGLGGRTEPASRLLPALREPSAPR